MMIALRRLAFAVVTIAFAAPASAQLPLGPTTKRFADIAQLAQEGYGDSARAAITRVLAGMARTDPLYVEALYTAGTVARTGDSMSSVFKRVYTDHSNTPWADRSLLRLIQIDFGSGRMELATNDATRFFSDFPDSPFMPAAAAWGARAAFSQQKLQLGCDWLTKGIAKVGDDLELRNQLLFAKQSCNVGPGVQLAPKNEDSLRAPPRPVPDTAHAPVPPPPSPTKPAEKTPAKPPTSVASPWRVQVTAVRDKAVIASVSKKIEAAGFKAYAVPGPGGLTRVQAGPFATRAAAVAALAKVKAATGGSPIVVAGP